MRPQAGSTGQDRQDRAESGARSAAGAKTAGKAAAKALQITIRKLPDFSRETLVLTRGLGSGGGRGRGWPGPLAGPVVAAAVVLDPARIPQGLDNSKMLPEGAPRGGLYEEIMATAHVSVSCVSASVIDEINILRASLEAMRRALSGWRCEPGSSSSMAGTCRPGRGRGRPSSGRGWARGVHRRGLHRGQGHAGPHHGPAGLALSRLRFRTARRLCHAEASAGVRSPRAMPFSPEDVRFSGCARR